MQYLWSAVHVINQHNYVRSVFIDYKSDSLFIKLPILSQVQGDNAYYVDEDNKNDILITRQIVLGDSLFGPISKIPNLQDYLNEHFTNPDIVPELKLVITIKIKNSNNYYEDMFSNRNLFGRIVIPLLINFFILIITRQR